jgi:hypothetical protein
VPCAGRPLRTTVDALQVRGAGLWSLTVWSLGGDKRDRLGDQAPKIMRGGVFIQEAVLQRVDAGNGGDRVGIGDHGRGFQQGDDECGSIDGGHSLGHPKFGIAEMRQAPRNRAVAAWG